MKFTKQAEYAVILASELAFCDKLRSLREISDHCQISYAMLRKVAHQMASTGLIKGEEGKGGGYILNRPPKEINLVDLLEAAGEQLKYCLCCEGERECADSAVCPRNSTLYALQGAIGEMLGNLTLADLMKSQCSCMRIWK